MRKRVCAAQWLLHHSICCLNRLDSPLHCKQIVLEKQTKRKRWQEILVFSLGLLQEYLWYFGLHRNMKIQHFFVSSELIWLNRHLTSTWATHARMHAHTHAPISSQVSITQRPTSDRITDAGTADRTHEPPLHFEFIDFLWRLQHANTRSRKQTNAFGH